LHQYGDYVLQLNATDGELDANDYVNITVNEPVCPVGDLNGDCKVDGQDLEIMMGLWLDNPGGIADLSDDNFVDFSDYKWLADNWMMNWQTGSLQAFIYPIQARIDGAQWRVDSGPWRTSSYIESDLAVGPHTVEFSEVLNWDKPDDQLVSVNYGEVTQADGNYSEHTGSIQVNISPPDVLPDAKWRLVGESQWHDSGETVSDVRVGFKVVEFSQVIDWVGPGNKDTEIFHNETTIVNVTYTEQGDVTLLINEFMASNNDDSGISDEHGDFDDWIEIYNATDTPVDIGGMYIADDQTKWQIPTGYSAQTTIGAYGYLVLWADDEEETEGPLHLAFQLDAGGDEIKLYDYDGISLLDSIAFDDQIANISYGRYPDGSNNWYYFTDPTEGTSNDQAGFADRVADTKFNPDRGFYFSPQEFEVAITTDTPGATIYYTTDGSAPLNTHTGSPAPGAQEYGPGNKPYITTTTCLRAAAVRAGYLPTNMDTHTYLFLDDVLDQATGAGGEQVTPTGYPTSWGSVTGDYQVDPEIVNHANPSDSLSTSDLQDVPTISVAMDVEDLFGSNQIYLSGDGVERLASIEMIYGDGSTGFQENGVIEIQGGSSTGRWKTYKLSMQFKFKDRMDDGTPTDGPTKLDYQVYPDSPIQHFDNLILDGVLNYSWLHPSQHTDVIYIADQYVADLHTFMGGMSPYGQYVHYYLNGLYWGMYYLHDRPDHSFAAEILGGNKDEYHALKYSNEYRVINNGNGYDAQASYNAMLSAGTDAGNNPTDIAKWQDLENRLDVDNMITYLLANWWAENTDWGATKNWYASGYGDPDGKSKWRYHSWDAEKCMKSSASSVGQIGECPSNLHNQIMPHIEYKMRWADNIHKHFHNGGVLQEGTPWALYQVRMNEADRAIVGESARWGDNRVSTPYTRSDWLSDNPQNGNFFNNRSIYVFNALKSHGLYPNTNPPEFEINSSPMYGGYVNLSDSLTMINPNGSGTIYYTLNGADPRLPGGAINTTDAITYSSGISLTQTVQVKARVLNGSEWSALSDAIFAIPTVAQNLRITELMYHPAGDPNAEFIELKHTGDPGEDSINLNLVSFTNGINYTFDDSVELYPGDYVVVYKNEAAFNTRYPGFTGTKVGPYLGALNNDGEEMR